MGLTNYLQCNAGSSRSANGRNTVEQLGQPHDDIDCFSHLYPSFSLAQNPRAMSDADIPGSCAYMRLQN
jgi:hypothetical protein